MRNKIYDLYSVDYLKKYKKYFQFLDNHIDKVDYLEVLPNSLLCDYLKDIDYAEEELKYLDKESYISRLECYDKLFNRLKQCSVDRLVLKSYLDIEKNVSLKSTLLSFKYLGGETRVVKYDNFKTTTGRLVVSDGPKCLTLPAKYRGVVKSSFENGKILSADFKSLEPRICLKLSGGETKGDIYEEINSMLSFNADRSVVKRATISLLYGSGLKGLEGLSIDRARELFNVVNNYFGYDKVSEMAQIVNEDNVRKNFFGRPINNLMESKKHILTNNFVQSTAVDVALMYFYKLVNKIDCKRARPLFIIHDAIVFDVESSYESELVEIINLGCEDEKLGFFPLKVESFN